MISLKFQPDLQLQSTRYVAVSKPCCPVSAKLLQEMSGEDIPFKKFHHTTTPVVLPDFLSENVLKKMVVVFREVLRATHRYKIPSLKKQRSADSHLSKTSKGDGTGFGMGMAETDDSDTGFPDDSDTEFPGDFDTGPPDDFNSPRDRGDDSRFLKP
jgi:hypothetical protein